MDGPHGTANATSFTQTGAGVTGLDWPCGCSCPRRVVLARVAVVIAVVVAVARARAALAVDRSLYLSVPFVPFVHCDNLGIAQPAPPALVKLRWTVVLVVVVVVVVVVALVVLNAVNIALS